MRFHVVGIDAVTGESREKDIEARTEKNALYLAKFDGIYTTKIILLNHASKEQQFWTTLTVLLFIVWIAVFLMAINSDMDFTPSTNTNIQDNPHAADRRGHVQQS